MLYDAVCGYVTDRAVLEVRRSLCALSYETWCRTDHADTGRAQSRMVTAVVDRGQDQRRGEEMPTMRCRTTTGRGIRPCGGRAAMCSSDGWVYCRAGVRQV